MSKVVNMFGQKDERLNTLATEMHDLIASFVKDDENGVPIATILGIIDMVKFDFLLTLAE